MKCTTVTLRSGMNWKMQKNCIPDTHDGLPPPAQCALEIGEA
jgi:hypothetical protein